MKQKPWNAKDNSISSKEKSLKMKKIKIFSDEQELKEIFECAHYKKYQGKFSRLKKNETYGSSELQERIKSTRKVNCVVIIK